MMKKEPFEVKRKTTDSVILFLFFGFYYGFLMVI